MFSLPISIYRRLPHLRPFAKQPIVYLTVVTHERCAILACQPALDTLTAIWQHSAEIDGWFVGDYFLMPDHVHFFARAALDAKSLAGWMETWKSLSSRRLKQSLKIAPPSWQRD